MPVRTAPFQLCSPMGSEANATILKGNNRPHPVCLRPGWPACVKSPDDGSQLETALETSALIKGDLINASRKYEPGVAATDRMARGVRCSEQVFLSTISTRYMNPFGSQCLMHNPGFRHDARPAFKATVAVTPRRVKSVSGNNWVRRGMIDDEKVSQTCSPLRLREFTGGHGRSLAKDHAHALRFSQAGPPRPSRSATSSRSVFCRSGGMSGSCAVSRPCRLCLLGGVG
jgi:hypothetical protein